MKERSAVMMIVLTFVTCTIYNLVYAIMSTNEMKELGGDVPHWILIFIPFVNIYFIWKWCAAVQTLSNGAQNGVILFILHMIGFVFIAQVLAQGSLPAKS